MDIALKVPVKGLWPHKKWQNDGVDSDYLNHRIHTIWITIVSDSFEGIINSGKCLATIEFISIWMIDFINVTFLSKIHRVFSTSVIPPSSAVRENQTGQNRELSSPQPIQRISVNKIQQWQTTSRYIVFCCGSILHHHCLLTNSSKCSPTFGISIVSILAKCDTGFGDLIAKIERLTSTLRRDSAFIERRYFPS